MKDFTFIMAPIMKLYTNLKVLNGLPNAQQFRKQRKFDTLTHPFWITFHWDFEFHAQYIILV